MVLGSSALTTGTKVVRAMTGTAIGVVLGAALIEMVGMQPAVLWMLMPIAIFVAAYVPRVASFTAGQAVLTMMVMIAYNLIAPTGWRAGLLRIEDVGAGAVVAVIAAVLLWPRGATASVHGVIGEAVSTASQYLQAAVTQRPRGASRVRRPPAGAVAPLRRIVPRPAEAPARASATRPVAVRVSIRSSSRLEGRQGSAPAVDSRGKICRASTCLPLIVGRVAGRQQAHS